MATPRTRRTEPYDFTYRGYGRAVAFIPPPAEAVVDVALVRPAPGGRNGG